VAKFTEILDGLGSVEDGAYPETMLDDLISAYDEDMSIPTAKIAELESANADANTVIAELKARNYDLLIAAAANNGEAVAPEDSSAGEDEAPAEITIDDLFESED